MQQIFLVVFGLILTNLILIKCQSEVTCTNPIYCQGNLLHTVQMARIFNDSKTFVDMSLIHSVETTLENFQSLISSTQGKPQRDDVRNFVNKNFEVAYELESYTLADFKSNPKFLKKIHNIVIRDFARNLVKIWPNLAKRVKQEVYQKPDRFSLIPLPHGFIAPGGRFKEFYYWDTYWIIRGLIISEMTDTVKGILDNFISLIDRYGFIPNGGRIYYLNRSHPPLLTLMVYEYIEATKDIVWLKENIKYLEKELQFWFKYKMVQINKNGTNYQLARYVTNSFSPRPESYIEDFTTASLYRDEDDRKKVYSHIKSGAESGWDFTTRWIFDKTGGNQANLSYIETERIIPIDLNAFLCRTFEFMSFFQSIVGNENRAYYWREKAIHWKKGIKKIMYDEEDGIWYDYDMKLGQLRKMFYPSNLIPLWTESYNTQLDAQYAKKAINYLKQHGILEYQGGIPTSLTRSGEQWDFPNAWAPLQSMVIFGLDKTGHTEATKIAKDLAKRWIRSNLKAFHETMEMFEKYNAIYPGEYGKGGEYVVQAGFGWTNGVALELIQHYYVNSTSKCL